MSPNVTDPGTVITMLHGPATIDPWADDPAAAESRYAEILCTVPHFDPSDKGGPTVACEPRIGDHRTGFRLVHRRHAPPVAVGGPGGVILHWHVDDARATLDRVPGAMENRHYLEMLSR
ncbi:hypothetical protein [Kitasatospora sp. NPDC002965]|uniref:VOC family protein n=1 Tax=Kitasatospora sp. NPDC002965 TaxID=3154775 RepID=UPI0033B141ED